MTASLSTTARRATLPVTMLVQAASSAAVLAPTVAAPRLLQQLNLGPSAVGLYIALVYLGAMVATQAAPVLVRRWGPILASQLALLASAAGLLLLALPVLPVAALGAVLSGLGYGPITPASSQMLSRTTDPRHFALVFSIKQTGVPLGGVIAGLMVPPLVAWAEVQVFMPDGPDGNWISASNIVGRAVGNLRQPNHLSSLLVWSAITTVALLEMKRLPRVLGPLVLAALVLGVVLTASRTGLVSVCILALWGLADRRMSRPTRGLLLLAPVLYALAWYGMARWADLSGHTFGGEARLAETDVSGSRFGIWSNTVAMIKAQPWLGTGFGEFNLAWTLTPFPGRPTAFFDHTHNLPLQLAVELGLPLAALVLALLLWALARVARQAWRAEGPVGHAQRAALMFVVMIGLHSLLEYPLWYSYFLLPAAWALGYGLGRPVTGGAAKGPSASPAAGLPWLAPAAALLVAGAAYSVWDYTRVTAIFSSADTTTSLAQRIQRGQRSTFFGHHADYAAATTEVDARLRARAFDSATHFLLDTRLMMAWAEALAARGDVDRARHLADRLREFRNALSKDWFAACDAAPPPGQPEPFQCKPAEKRYSWRDFVPQR